MIARLEPPQGRELDTAPPPRSRLAAWAWPIVLVLSGATWAMIGVVLAH